MSRRLTEISAFYNKPSNKGILQRFGAFPQLPEIITAAYERPVSYVFLPTGNGKTSGLSWAFALLSTHPSLFAPLTKVLVSLPTIASVRAQMAFATENLPSNLTELFAYACNSERSVNFDRAPVAFSTTQTIVNLMLQKKRAGCTNAVVILLDEAHTFSSENHQLLLLADWITKSGVAKHIHFVVATATPTPYLFATYPALMEGATKMVPTSFQEEESRRSFSITDYWEDDDPVRVTKQLIIDKNKIFSLIRNRISFVLKRHAKEGRNIIVFVGGEADATLLAEDLEEEVCDVAYSTRVVCSAVKDSIRDILGCKSRTIFIATNFAESSVTLPNVGFVIDSGLQKLMTETQDGVKLLKELPCSRQQRLQRRGRTGRQCHGFYFPLCSRNFVATLRDIEAKHLLPVHPPEAKEKCYLAFLVANLPAEAILRLSEGEARELKRDFTRTGLLTGDGRPTSLGRFVSSFPLETKLAAALATTVSRCDPSWSSGHLSQLIVAASLVDCAKAGDSSRIFYVPTKEKKSKARFLWHAEELTEFRGEDDFRVALRIFKWFLTIYSISAKRKEMAEKCKKRFLRYSFLQQWYRRAERVARRFAVDLRELRRCELDFAPLDYFAENCAKMMPEKVLIESRFAFSGEYKDSRDRHYEISKHSLHTIHRDRPVQLLAFSKLKLEQCSGAEKNIASICLILKRRSV